MAGQGSICLYPWHSRVRSRKITVKSKDNLVYNSEYQVGKGYRVDTLSQKKKNRDVGVGELAQRLRATDPGSALSIHTATHNH